jgi:S-layer protein
MENRKIRAKGNVHVEYQTDKSAGNVFDNMTSNTKTTKK